MQAWARTHVALLIAEWLHAMQEEIIVPEPPPSVSLQTSIILESSPSGSSAGMDDTLAYALLEMLEATHPATGQAAPQQQAQQPGGAHGQVT